MVKTKTYQVHVSLEFLQINGDKLDGTHAQQIRACLYPEAGFVSFFGSAYDSENSFRAPVLNWSGVWL